MDIRMYEGHSQSLGCSEFTSYVFSGRGEELRFVGVKAEGGKRGIAP